MSISLTFKSLALVYFSSSHRLVSFPSLPTEEINSGLFKRTLKAVNQVLKDSNLKKSDIDEIVLVGGSTRIPKIQELLKEFFDGKELFKGINPDEAVAWGAAVQGGIRSGIKANEGTIVMNVTPLSLGIEVSAIRDPFYRAA